MEEAGTITIISNKQEVALNVNQILYVQMQGNSAFIHTPHRNDTLDFMGKRLLLVEDNALNRELALEILFDTLNRPTGNPVGR